MICQSSSFLAAGFGGWDCFWARRTSSSIIRIALEVCWHWTITNSLSSRKRDDPIWENMLKRGTQKTDRWRISVRLKCDFSCPTKSFPTWLKTFSPADRILCCDWLKRLFTKWRRIQQRKTISIFNEEQTTVWNPVDKSNWNEDEYRKKERQADRQTDRQKKLLNLLTKAERVQDGKLADFFPGLLRIRLLTSNSTCRVWNVENYYWKISMPTFEWYKFRLCFFHTIKSLQYFHSMTLRPTANGFVICKRQNLHI